jgi:hypothetical protein
MAQPSGPRSDGTICCAWRRQSRPTRPLAARGATFAAPRAGRAGGRGAAGAGRPRRAAPLGLGVLGARRRRGLASSARDAAGAWLPRRATPLGLGFLGARRRSRIGATSVRRGQRRNHDVDAAPGSLPSGLGAHLAACRVVEGHPARGAHSGGTARSARRRQGCPVGSTSRRGVAFAVERAVRTTILPPITATDPGTDPSTLPPPVAAPAHNGRVTLGCTRERERAKRGRALLALGRAMHAHSHS